MRNKIPWTMVRLAAGLLTITVIGGGTAYAGSVVQKNNLIGEEAAEEFAILDAGVKPDEVSGMHTDLEKDNGQYVYDIVFYAGDIKYEYELLAEDGKVLEKEVEKKKEKVQAKTTTDKASGTSENKNSSQIKSEEKAAETASETEKEKSTQTGADQSAQDKQADGQTQKSTESTYISVDEAKQIALDHAELTEEEVMFSTAKFENDDDDGEEYEIEFYVGDIEYEYEIDAITGEIRDFSKEQDDD